MADAEQAIAPGELETATAGQQQQADEPVNLDAPQEAPEEGQATEEELEEYEWDGKPFRGPKGLKNGFLMHGDYTRKTQETAEIKRELERERAQHAQLSKLSEDDIRDRGTLYNLDQQLADYAKLGPADWEAHASQDPIGTEGHWRTYQLLKEQREGLNKAISERAAQRNHESQQSFAKRLEETRDFAQKNIPGWSTDLSSKVLEYAGKDLGLTRDFVTDNMSPQFLTLLHRAYVGGQALQKPATATIPSNVMPLVTVGAKSNPSAGKSLAELAKSNNMDEFARSFNERMAKRGQ